MHTRLAGTAKKLAAFVAAATSVKPLAWSAASARRRWDWIAGKVSGQEAD